MDIIMSGIQIKYQTKILVILETFLVIVLYNSYVIYKDNAFKHLYANLNSFSFKLYIYAI